MPNAGALPVCWAKLAGAFAYSKGNRAVIPSKNARDSMAMLAMLRRGNAHANWHRALWGDSRASKKVK
jgi:hypothetical protein